MNCFLYLEGLKELSIRLRGDEKIHLGIRPYQFHAGNILSIGAYPYLLCEEVKKLGKTPRFTFIISLNDWEQDELVGEDIYRYIFDVRPKHTTIQHLKADNGENMTDHWETKIKHELKLIIQDFPEVKIGYVRNSELRYHPLMQEALIHTLNNRHKHKEILLKYSKKPTNGTDTRFANAVCDKCYNIDTESEVLPKKLIRLTCTECGKNAIGSILSFNYWFYHKELFSARLAILRFDVSISGSDHYAEGDYATRKALYELIYEKPFPNLKMLFAPILLSDDGQKMSKSRDNYKYIPLGTILSYARTNINSSLSLNNASIEALLR
ncbi:hypothetical protein HYS84_02575 [Candidatus Saccharibacteria bacterium]|nr:hypothetical protein [Candidatus Saccharibacteria bacterium]